MSDAAASLEPRELVAWPEGYDIDGAAELVVAEIFSLIE